jgi:lysophospholipase L1-like esterase
MKKTIKFKRELFFLSIFIIILIFNFPLFSQTVKIMPVGNSITWGKVNHQPPPGDSEGYRKELHEKLIAERVSNPDFPAVEFVGSEGTIENRGLFIDNARVGWFIHADSTMGDMSNQLNTYQPDIVILHVGTNDIFDQYPVGNYATEGSIIYRLYILVDKIVSNPDVDDLILCKIIPNFRDPGVEETTSDYNNAIEIMLNQFTGLKREKITLVDMHSPFFAKQTEYYNLSVDKTHPNQTGYAKMADIFFQYMKKLFNPSFTDHFDRSSLGSDWVAASGIQIEDVGESGGGTIRYVNTDPAGAWSHLAVWKTSKNLSSISMKCHADSSNTAGLQAVGFAVGLDSVGTDADGYLVWIYNQKVRVYTIVDGSASGSVDDADMSNLQPGDVFKITYRQDPSANIFAISVNDDPNRMVTLMDNQKQQGNSTDIYSGILFRGHPTTPYKSFIDYFQVEAELPDPVAPGAPLYFQFITMSNTTITLSWLSPGDDNYIGRAASYDLRYSLSHIGTEADFLNANIVPGVVIPEVNNTYQEHIVTGLMPGTRYYFRIRATDSWGNQGELSAEVTVKTNSSGMNIESFDRPPEPDGSAGDDWIFDPTEYTIDYNAGTGEGEFVNFLSDGLWGKTAIYTGRTNPIIVKIVWGRSATVDGIGRGGIAVMLTQPSLNTRGYLVFIRTHTNMIYLYDINNGEAVQTEEGKIDQVAYTLKDLDGNLRKPQKSDTMSVVMDWINESGHKFDIFINGQPASDRALYDQERRYNSTLKYSGIMLSGVTKTNSVSAFATQSEPSPIGGIEKISIDGTGTVGTALTDDSLKVMVRDGNNTPLPNIPVWFWVIDPPEASVSSPDRMIDPIQIEAEWCTPEGTYVIKEDPQGSSGGAYVVGETGGARSGTLDYWFNVEQDTSYYIWGRLVSSWINSMTVIIQVDDRDEWTWNSFYTDEKDQFSTKWQWDMVNHNYGEPKRIELGRGLHHLKVIKAHDGVRIDKFLITADGSFMPIGKQVFDVLLTDQKGEAGTVLTMGPIVGNNRVRARPFGTAETVDFVINGLPDYPTTMYKSNDGQEGAARDTLDLPFIVTLSDKYGNLTPNIPVTFEVVDGDGQLTVTDTTTNDDGEASTYLILGLPNKQNPIILVRATFTGYTGSNVDFMASVGEGLIEEIIPLTETDHPRHYINDILPNFLKVKLINDKGEPVENVPVDFDIIQGEASAGSKQKYTNSLGIAQDTLFMGDEAGILKIKASGGGQETLFEDSVFYRGATLRSYSGDKGIAQIGGQLNWEIRVQVKDKTGDPVRDHPVTFKTKGNGFKLPVPGSNDITADSVTVFTNISGIAGTNVIAGMIHGQYTDIVEAYSTDGFYFISGTPVSFTLYVESPAAKLVNAMDSNINMEGVVKSLFDYPLKVKMLDTDDNPVPEQPVIFQLISGGGKFESSLMSQIPVMTDGDGFAEVIYELGPKAGTDNNIIEATATNGRITLHNVPIEFKISAKSSAADSILAYYENPLEKNLSGTAGKSLSKPVEVQIVDQQGNPVYGEIVTFTVIKGGGILNDGASKTVVDTIDNANGVVSVNWTLGDTSGTNNNILTAVSSNGLVPLKGSPVYFYASADPDSVSKVRSVIETDLTMYNASDTCWVTVTLKDRYGNPVPNKRIEIFVTGSMPNYTVPPLSPTDSTGKAVCFFISEKAGEKIVRVEVKDDNIFLDKEVYVTYLADAATKMEAYSSGTMTGNVGTILRDSIAVRITDANDNPVAYGPVTFEVTRGGGEILGPKTVPSDSNGIASVHVLLGPQPGINMIRVTSSQLQPNELSFSVMGEKGSAAYIFLVDGNDQTGVAGERLDEPFVVGVTDEELQPVSGIEVEFKVDKGNGYIDGPSLIKTNEYGYASAFFVSDTIAGVENFVTANNDTLAGGPALFKPVSEAGSARKLVYISGSQSGQVNKQADYPLRAGVTDKFGNSVGGVPVLFEIISGDASFDGSTEKTVNSNSSGEAQTYVNLGKIAGRVVVHASGKMLVGSPVEFIIDASATNGVTIERFYREGEEEIIKATINQPLADPLRVKVIDPYDNPVAGTNILFKILLTNNETGGVLDPPNGISVSDSYGIASIQFISNSKLGMAKVKAMMNNDEYVSFNIEKVNNPNFPVLQKDMLDQIITFYENEKKQFAIIGSDRDADMLTFQIGNLIPPRGAYIEQTTNETAIFGWTPDYDQAGTYEVILRVIDGRGGVDSDTITINVNNTNRTPINRGVIPSVKDTVVSGGEPVLFWIDAFDPDGDKLNYEWRVDNINQSNNAEVFELKTHKKWEGYKNIDVFVRDEMASISHRWRVEVISTKVELSEFLAIFDEWKRAITIRWKTSVELDNLGFDVYRSLSMYGRYEKINEELIMNHNTGEYTFTDETIQAGYVYYYKLIDQDISGNKKEHGPISIHIPRPTRYILNQNYPNPFNPETKIKYQVPSKGHVKITIFNMMGQRVKTLVNKEHYPGYYAVDWDGRDAWGNNVSTGIYIYCMRSDNKTLTRRMVKLQ